MTAADEELERACASIDEETREIPYANGFALQVPDDELEYYAGA